MIDAPSATEGFDRRMFVEQCFVVWCDRKNINEEHKIQGPRVVGGPKANGFSQSMSGGKPTK
jgi:hypothetical protein